MGRKLKKQHKKNFLFRVTALHIMERKPFD